MTPLLALAPLFLLFLSCLAGPPPSTWTGAGVYAGVSQRQPRGRAAIFGQEVLFSIETTAFKDYKMMYVANMVGDELDPGNPVDFFWVHSTKMKEKEQVGYLAKSLAFGCTVTPGALPGSYIIALNAVKTRRILVHVDELSGGPIAVVILAGRVAYLQSMFVHATQSWVGWTVVYVEIVGADIETGEPVIERLE